VPPRDPEAKGLVERANGDLQSSFLPGRVFTGPDDFNAQLTAWLQVANRRHHRRIGARPVDRWEADRAAMLTIPPVAPPNWWPLRTRLGRDHCIRLDTCDYSVHPRAIGHVVQVRSDTEEITVTCGDDVSRRALRARRPRRQHSSCRNPLVTPGPQGHLRPSPRNHFATLQQTAEQTTCQHSPRKIANRVTALGLGGSRRGVGPPTSSVCSRSCDPGRSR